MEAVITTHVRDACDLFKDNSEHTILIKVF